MSFEPEQTKPAERHHILSVEDVAWLAVAALELGFILMGALLWAAR